MLRRALQVSAIFPALLALGCSAGGNDPGSPVGAGGAATHDSGPDLGPSILLGCEGTDNIIEGRPVAQYFNVRDYADQGRSTRASRRARRWPIGS
jgi:hypothetical protein